MSLEDIAAEALKRHRTEESKIQTKKFLILIGGGILLLAGLAVGGYLFFSEKEILVQENFLQPPKSLILSEKQQVIILKTEDGPELKDSIAKIMESSVAENTILDIPVYLQTENKKEFINAQKFFQILEINPPGNFTQSLDGGFMLGIFNSGKNSTFLIFKIRSFDLAFSGALSWEKSMAESLKDAIFVKSQISGPKKFMDKIVKNHDVRVLYDAANSPLLAYAFIARDYFIITTDFVSLEEIFKRNP